MIYLSQKDLPILRARDRAKTLSTTATPTPLPLPLQWTCPLMASLLVLVHRLLDLAVQVPLLSWTQGIGLLEAWTHRPRRRWIKTTRRAHISTLVIGVP